jgi:hypothetical protein
MQFMVLSLHTNRSMLTVFVLHLCTFADDDPVVACPISISLGYLKGVLPDHCVLLHADTADDEFVLHFFLVQMMILL